RTRVTRNLRRKDQPADVRILPGMSGELRARLEPPNTQAKAMEVLASALFEGSDGATCVWLVDISTMTVHRQPVKTQRPTTVGFLVEGLKAGQTVVTGGVHYLKEGQKVRIMESPGEDAKPVLERFRPETFPQERLQLQQQHLTAYEDRAPRRRDILPDVSVTRVLAPWHRFVLPTRLLDPACHS